MVVESFKDRVSIVVNYFMVFGLFLNVNDLEKVVSFFYKCLLIVEQYLLNYNFQFIVYFLKVEDSKFQFIDLDYGFFQVNYFLKYNFNIRYILIYSFVYILLY